MKLIPIFAFGSRGDILPLLSIVERLVNVEKSILSDVNIVLITHRCYCDEVIQQFGNKIETIAIDSKVFDISNSDSNDFYIHDYISAFTNQYDMKKVRIVIGNLFAMKIWHFALSLHVQCIFIHPNLPPTRSKDHKDLMNSFKDFQPILYNTAIEQKDSQTSSLTFNDYNYFLWPTLVDHFDESLLTIEKESINGPIVLILCSSRIWTLPCKHSRYHVCGFIKSGYFGEILQLNTITSLENTALQPHHLRFTDSIPVLSDTAEVLQFIELQSPDDQPMICVDFGSMTDILVNDGRLVSIIQILLVLPTARRYLIVAHGCKEKVLAILLEAIAASRAYSSSSSSGSSTTVTTITMVTHSVDHSKLLPRCTSAIHHGGIGTIGACMLAGIPQVILEVMYDQHKNGIQMENKKIGRSMALDSLLELKEEVGEIKAVQWMETALRYCSNPPQRLRAACLGRDMRDDPAEDGLRNAVEVLKKYINAVPSNCSFHNPETSVQQGAILPCTSKRVETTAAAAIPTTGTNYSVESRDACNELILLSKSTVQLPNGLQISAHIQRAPEETLFLYQEIFIAQVYQRYVQCLQPGDLVVDIGANIGLFSLYCAQYCDTVRVVAVEPVPENRELLLRNLLEHSIPSLVYACAVGVSSSGDNSCSSSSHASSNSSSGSSGSSSNTRVNTIVVAGATPTTIAPFSNQTRQQDPICREFTVLDPQHTQIIRYYPTMPGNSCSIARVSPNLSQMQGCMNPFLLQSACASAQERICAVMGLSQILLHYEQLQLDDATTNAVQLTIPSSSSGCPGSKTSSNNNIDSNGSNSIGTKRPYVGINSTTSYSCSSSSSNTNNMHNNSRSHVLPSPRIALLKIDVEGEEISVLRSIVMKSHWINIHLIIVECHSDNVNRVKQLLEEQNFDVCNNEENADCTGNILLFAENLHFYSI